MECASNPNIVTVSNDIVLIVLQQEDCLTAYLQRVILNPVLLEQHLLL